MWQKVGAEMSEELKTIIDGLWKLHDKYEDAEHVVCADAATLLSAQPDNQPQNNKQESEPLYGENENFIQTKYGYCFYSLGNLTFIYNLYVHPQYRRCGHSRGLLRLVINEIRKSGYKGAIFIQAEPREDSIVLSDLMKYYKSMGLVIYEGHKPRKDGDKE
jgi:GNAT superfamily N-acetyltransferase